MTPLESVLPGGAVAPSRPARKQSEDPKSACAGTENPEIFFPDRADPATAALAACSNCLAVRDCAAEALSTRERYGVWGGMTERDRELWWARQSRRATVARRRGA